MAIEFLCPHCQRRLRVPADSAGRSARCPGCSQVSQIPTPNTPPPAEQLEISPFGTPAPSAFAEPPTPRQADSENPYATPHGSYAPHENPTGIPRRTGSPLASRSRRLIGAIVDGVVRLGIVLVALIIPGMIAIATQGNADEEVYIALCIGFAALGAFVGAAINWYLITTSGQSVAKRWLGMRIVRIEDERLPGFMYGVLLRIWIPALINQACGLFSLVDPLFIFGDEQRCVHDMIASTNVIDVATERQYYP